MITGEAMRTLFQSIWMAWNALAPLQILRTEWGSITVGNVVQIWLYLTIATALVRWFMGTSSKSQSSTKSK